MVAKIQILRSVTPGSRPSGKTYGEPYVNFGDNQFGVFDSSNVARDLIGVPYFSAALSYIQGATVNYQGKLYQSITSVAAGAWNPAQWALVVQQFYVDSSVNAFCPQNCRFICTGTTTTNLSPFNGSKIKINGAYYDIPASGIQAVNTNLMINGVGGRTLAASAPYYVFAFATGPTTIGLDFRTTGAGGYAHVMSSTPGNLGVEIMCNTDGSGKNDGYTFVGLIVASSASQFSDTVGTRQVLSWYNRRPKSLLGPAIGAVNTTATGAQELSPSQRQYFLNWINQDVYLGVIGYSYIDTAGQATFIQVSSDGVILTNPFPYNTHAAVSYANNLSFGQWMDGTAAPFASELGLHSSSIVGAVTGGTGTFNVRQTGMIFG
jgi:hypothetical protein